MSKKALTLIEIIVSMVILALIMGGIANLFVATKRQVLRSRSRMVVGELGRHFLDPLQAQVDQSNWGSNCLSTGTCPDQTENLDGIDYTATYTVSPNQPIDNVNKVEVTISWPELQ